MQRQPHGSELEQWHALLNLLNPADLLKLVVQGGKILAKPRLGWFDCLDRNA